MARSKDKHAKKEQKSKSTHADLKTALKKVQKSLKEAKKALQRKSPAHQPKQKYGSKVQVWNGTAEMTQGGVKINGIMEKGGRLVYVNKAIARLTNMEKELKKELKKEQKSASKSKKDS